ncbi:hypothetical protein L1987_18750 [Smallanthus sonchifolius]|uniref:Uncharacterized protein n=1 Tax=Smallanthus sonchifolius TaxID=185202 RepID=A0ACB9J1M6_9ASTR|nr:hypothetical protein L1987_18750 [Smallanthus sonchifolius]
MSSANPQPAPLQPIVSDDKDIQEEPDQVSESEPEEGSEEEPVGDMEGADFDTDSGETVPWSVMHGEDTRSEEVQPPTPSPPRLPSHAPLCSDWVNLMGLASRWTARKIVLPLMKRALSSTDDEPFPKRHCLTSQQVIRESSHQVRPQEVGPTEPTIPPSTERSETQPDPRAQ